MFATETTDACGNLVRWPLTAAGSRTVLALGAGARAHPVRLAHGLWLGEAPLCLEFCSLGTGPPIRQAGVLCLTDLLCFELCSHPLRLNKLESCIIMVAG